MQRAKLKMWLWQSKWSCQRANGFKNRAMDGSKLLRKEEQREKNVHSCIAATMSAVIWSAGETEREKKNIWITVIIKQTQKIIIINVPRYGDEYSYFSASGLLSLSLSLSHTQRDTLARLLFVSFEFLLQNYGFYAKKNLFIPLMMWVCV